MKRLIAAATLVLLAAPLVLVSGASLDLMVGNDNITYGIVRNSDDGLSFGAKIALRIGPHEVALSLGSLTSRGQMAQDGLTQVGRYDELALGCERAFVWTVGKTEFGLAPCGGLALVGPLGLAKIQNFLHRLMGKAPVDLPQDYEAVRFFPSIGVRVSCFFEAGRLLSIGLDEALVSRIPFDLRNSVGLAFRVGGRLGLKIGYRSAVDLQKAGGSHAAQISRDNGVELALGVDGGLVVLDYRANLSGRFAYGLIGIDPLALGDRESFDDLGVAVLMGVEAGAPIQMHRLAFERADWVLKLAYKGGEIRVGAMERRAFADYALGRRILWRRGPLSPFVLPFLGVKQYIFYKPGSVCRGRGTMLREYRFMAGLEAGVRIGEKGALRIGGCGLSLETGLGAKICFGADSVPVARFPGLEDFVGVLEIKWFADILIDL